MRTCLNACCASFRTGCSRINGDWRTPRLRFSTSLGQEAHDPFRDFLALVLLQEVAGAGDNLRRTGARDPRRQPLGRIRREDRVGVREQDESRPLPAFEPCAHLEHLRGGRVVDVAEAGENSLLVHDSSHTQASLAFALSRITFETDGAVPLGVFRSVERPVYDDLMGEQLETAREQSGEGDLSALLHSGDTWTVAASD